MFKAIITSIAAATPGPGFSVEVAIQTDDGRPVEQLSLKAVLTKEDAADKVGQRLRELQQREMVAQWASELVGAVIATI